MSASVTLVSVYIGLQYGTWLRSHAWQLCNTNHIPQQCKAPILNPFQSVLTDMSVKIFDIFNLFISTKYIFLG